MSTTSDAVVYNPYDYEIHEDPYPTYERLRDEAPLYRNDEMDFWALSRHADVLEGFRDCDTLLQRARRVARSRRLAARTPTRRCRSSPWTRRCTAACAAWCRGASPRDASPSWSRASAAIARELPRPRCSRQGSVDFIADFAGRLPMDVISELMGVPVADRDELRRLSDLLVHREDGVHDVPPEGMAAALEPGRLLRRHARRSGKATPTDDLTSALLAAEIDGDRLTDDEIIGFLFLMVVAGNETTTKLLANAWYWAWRNPDERAKPFADPGRTSRCGSRRRCATTPRSQMLARVTTADVRAARPGDPRGRPGACCSRLGQPRPRVFADPDRYDLDRAEPLPQLASFGFGRHFCLGASLARLEARVALEELVACLRDLRDRRRPASSGSTRSTCAASPRCRRRRRAPRLHRPRRRPLMPRFEPHPERRRGGRHRRLVRHRRGHRARRSPQPAIPSCSAPAASTAARSWRRPDPRRRRRGDRPAARPDRQRLDHGLRPTGARPSSGPIEVLVSNAGDVQPDHHRRRGSRRSSPVSCRSTCSAPRRSCHAVVPAHVRASARRRRVRRPPRSRSRPAPTWRPTSRRRPASRASPRPWPMELRGHRRARRHRAPGPVVDRAGHHLGRGHHQRGRGVLVRVGPAAPRRRRCAPSEMAQAVLAVVSAPKGTRYAVLEVQPEAPVDARRDHDDHDHRTAQGLRRRRRHRPPRGVPHRPDRPDAARPRRVRRRRLSSAWPTRTSCC